jgi:hypothetical protein
MSGELNVFIGLPPRSGRAEDSVSLADVVGMEESSNTAWMPPQVSDESRLEPFLQAAAEGIRRYAQAGLAGDRMYFRRLEVFRCEKADLEMRRNMLSKLRAEAAEAWRKRQFAKVVSLYVSVEKELTESERLKLRYARERCLD